MTMWMAQTTASGMVPWFHWLGGAPEDTRWKSVGRDFFQWLAAQRAALPQCQHGRGLAVLYPQRTIAFYRSGARDRVPTSEYLQGLYYALLEGRFLFDFVHEDRLSAERLRRYRALLLPNVAYLDEEACQAIRAYVRSGGSLLATFESSRYGPWGEPRSDFGLADVLRRERRRRGRRTRREQLYADRRSPRDYSRIRRNVASARRREPRPDSKFRSTPSRLDRRAGLPGLPS